MQMTGIEIINFAIILVLVRLANVNGILISQNSNIENSDENEAAATYIPFIMNLIKLSLTQKEKLYLSQNVYNAFLKQQSSVKNSIPQTSENNFNRKSGNKISQAHVFSKSKPYILRF